MAYAHKYFDHPLEHPDGEISHHKGLNIFAVIIDNTDGEVMAVKQNNIHSCNNSFLHA